MTDTSRIPKAEISGIFSAIVKRFSKKMLGDVAEPVGVYWHNNQCSSSTSALARNRASGTLVLRT